MQAGTIQIYILAGQSDMVGYGLLPDLTAAEKTANPIIKVYGNDWVQRNALDPLDINTNQVDPVSDENGNPMRVGLGDKARDPDKALGYTYWTAMQSNQANINYRCTANVSAKGLTQNPDEVHLNTAGQRALGPRLAAAMLTLRQTCT